MEENNKKVDIYIEGNVKCNKWASGIIYTMSEKDGWDFSNAIVIKGDICCDILNCHGKTVLISGYVTVKEQEEK